MVRYLIARYNVSAMDSGYRLLAARYIRRQAKQLAEQFDGVRAAEDIEFVHRARVATRRLRAALRMFHDCFARKQFRRWRKAIRRTTAKLGDARDRDVQIELLCGTLSALNAKECFPGISRILVQLERDRERLQRKVVKAVDRLEAQGILRQMRRATKRILQAAGVGGRRRADPRGLCPDPAAHPSATRRTAPAPGQPGQSRRTASGTMPCGSPPSGCGTPWRSPGPCIPGGSTRPSRRSSGCNRSWARSTTATSGPNISMRLPPRSASALRPCSAMPAGLPVCSRESTILRQDRRRHRQEVFGQLVEYWAELGRAAVLGRARRRGAGPRPDRPIAAASAAGRRRVRDRRRQRPRRGRAMPSPDPVSAVASESAPDRGPEAQSAADDPTSRVWPAARKPLLTAGS